jgi:hypothetical protein
MVHKTILNHCKHGLGEEEGVAIREFLFTYLKDFSPSLEDQQTAEKSLIRAHVKAQLDPYSAVASKLVPNFTNPELSDFLTKIGFKGAMPTKKKDLAACIAEFLIDGADEDEDDDGVEV